MIKNILFITLTASAMPTNASFCMIVCVDVIIVTTGSKPLFLTTAKIDSVRKNGRNICENNILVSSFFALFAFSLFGESHSSASTLIAHYFQNL